MVSRAYGRLDQLGETELIAAVRQGAVNNVMRLLEMKAAPDEPDRFGETALMEAVSQGDSRMCEMLLLYNADPHKVAPSGLSLFQLASEHTGLAPIFNDPGQWRQDSLRRAAARHDVDSMRMLIHPPWPLAYGARSAFWEPADLVSIKDGAGCTLLHVAASKPPESHSGRELCRLILYAHAAVDVKSGVGETPLLLAVRALADATGKQLPVSLRLSVVNELVRVGAKINTTDSVLLESPLMEAACMGDPELIALLLEVRADPNQRNANGQTAITLACKDSVRRLLQGGHLVGARVAGGDGVVKRVNSDEQPRHGVQPSYRADSQPQHVPQPIKEERPANVEQRWKQQQRPQQPQQPQRPQQGLHAGMSVPSPTQPQQTQHTPSQKAASSPTKNSQSKPTFGYPAPGCVPTPQAKTAQKSREFASSADPTKSAGREGLQRVLQKFPGFKDSGVVLPVGCEQWTVQELELYIGSLGQIWPKGRQRSASGTSGTCSGTASAQLPLAILKQRLAALGLSAQDTHSMADGREIKRAYREAALRWHPDKNSSAVDAAQKFQAASDAYQDLRRHFGLTA